MVSLLDIAPLSKPVLVREQQVDVLGISVLGVASLLKRYPVLQEALAGRETESLTADGLLRLVPDAIAAIIAAGCGTPDDADVEAVIAGLTISEQLDLLTAILELTFPRGVSPFLEKLGNLQSAAGFAVGSKAPVGS